MENISENAPFEADSQLPPFALASTPEIVSFSIHTLKNHPLSDAIYGTELEDDFLESIRTLGVLQPILVVKKSLEIISGNSRVKAARTLGHEVIQGTYFSSDNDLEIQQAVLESNSQRVKTNEQKIREYNARKTIESELSLQRKAAANPEVKPTKAVTREAQGKARENAAKKIGVSTNVAEKATKVIAEADRLKDEGKEEESSELINALNKSIKTAHRMVTQKDAPAETETAKPKPAVPAVSSPAEGEAPLELVAQEDFIGAGRAIVRFLRTHAPSDFTSDEAAEWRQIAEDISGRLAELKFL